MWNLGPWRPWINECKELCVCVRKRERERARNFIELFLYKRYNLRRKDRCYIYIMYIMLYITVYNAVKYNPFFFEIEFYSTLYKS